MLILLACVVIAVGASVTFSTQAPKRYTAEASLLFRDPGFDETLFGTPLGAQRIDPNREAATNVRLVSLDVVQERAARALNISRARVESAVTVKAQETADVVTIEAEDLDPRFAAALANTFAREYIAFRTEADRRKIAAAQTLVERRLNELTPEQLASPSGRTLRTAAQQLTTLESLQTGNAELVQRAVVPTSPSSPKPIRSAVLALLLGGLLGVGLALLRERTDRRVHTAADVASILDLPVLGQVPVDHSLKSLRNFREARSSAAIEAVQLLRANLRYFEMGRELKTLAITSASAGEGKSTMAWSIAANSARAGISVLLIEADLRRPTMVERLIIPPGPGLSSVLIDEISMADAIVSVPVAAEETDEGPSMDVITSGPLPPNPAQLLESPKMRRVLTEAEALYDLVVLDTTPIAILADAVPMVTQTSAVLVVARLQTTTKDALRTLRTALANVQVKPIGAVVNNVSAGHGYGYGYGYGGDASLDAVNRVGREAPVRVG